MKMTQEQIDDWNARFPVGSRGWVDLGKGGKQFFHTRSKGWLLENGEAVVMVDCVTGCYGVDFIHMCDSHDAPQSPK